MSEVKRLNKILNNAWRVLANPSLSHRDRVDKAFIILRDRNEGNNNKTEV